MKEKKVFYTVCICSILLLLTMCYFGTNFSIKGTSASNECDDKYSVEHDGVTYCCPNRRDSIEIYNANYYCFDATKEWFFLDGICVASVMMTSYEHSLAFIQGDAYKNAFCKSKQGNDWYYSKGALCDYVGAVPKCTCYANASECTTLATKPKKTVTLTYNANGGSVTSTTDTCTTDGTIKNTCKISSSEWPIATKGEYVFNGWSSTENCPNGSGSTVNIELGDDKTVWACWVRKKVTFDANGGTGGEDVECTSFVPNSNMDNCKFSADQLPMVSMSGWVFNGWTASKNCASTVGTGRIEDGKYKLEASLVAAAGGTLYACWKRTSTIKFVYVDDVDQIIKSYDCNRYNGDISACTFDAPETVEPLDAEKTEFIGWSQKKDCDYPSNDKSFSIYSNDIRLYACFKKTSNPSPPSNPSSPSNPSPPSGEPEEKTYNVTFDANGGSVDKNSDSCKSTTGSCEISDLPTATWDNYTFKGWGTSKTCTSGNTSSITLTETSNTYYACWIEKEIITDTNPEEPDEEIKEDTKPSEDSNGNVNDGPPTGENTLIAIIWFFGLLAIGYAYYYFKEVKNH